MACCSESCKLAATSLIVQQGSPYPALYRLEASGVLATEWSTSDNNRRAKSHCLTEIGRLQLTNETERWREMAKIIASVLRLTVLPESEVAQ